MRALVLGDLFLGARLVGRGRWQFDALAYVQARDFSNVVISATSFRKTLDQRRTPSTGLGGKLEVRPPLGPNHVARLGVDYRLASGELQVNYLSLADLYLFLDGTPPSRDLNPGTLAVAALTGDDECRTLLQVGSR